MIIGIGTDVVELDRIRRIHERFGLRFLEKLLVPEEIETLPPRPVATIAGRLAAKEAAVKALGTGFSLGISPGQVVILKDALGRPLLDLRDAALERARALGVGASHLSISHERSVAVAIVILEKP
ncbi:MAG: holo-ACP synthase [Desulfovibrio sp.]|jgi:holo-[acyl-carrier protein] synthase|nr:holo-ACP synthase [Desulfovibrio sp.]